MKKLLTLLIVLVAALATGCMEDTFSESSGDYAPPSGLKYMDVTNGREGKLIVSGVPSVSTGNLIPTFEIVGGFDANGNPLDASYMDYVSIANPATAQWNLRDKNEYPLDADGNPYTGGTNVNLLNAGVITIAEGNPFTVGDYTFSVRVSTQADGKTYATLFDPAFRITIEPLLPPFLLYQLKTQNLIWGDSDSKTVTPLIPIGNQDVSFELADNTDKLQIDPQTGSVSLSPAYQFTARETIYPTVRVVSNISGESVSFGSSLVVIVTDTPEQMPVESVHFFYPTLFTTGKHPTGGDGFTVQTPVKGLADQLWGPVANTEGRTFETPEERPETNTNQLIIESAVNSISGANSAWSEPVNCWLIMQTQDFTPYRTGYSLHMEYYYKGYFQNYMSDGRSPTLLEVYLSTDYTGGDIQHVDGTWTGNGTWTQINPIINWRRGTQTGPSYGAVVYVGTPYPGDQSGEDPDGVKTPDFQTTRRWLKCFLDITEYKDCKTFTVAFKIASYFTGTLKNNAEAPGRAGRYWITDFHYTATELELQP